MKRLLGAFLFFGAALIVLNACQTPGCTDPQACNYNPNATQNNGTCDYSCYGTTCNGSGVITKSGHITQDETWDAACVYRLDGHVIVDPNVTLTILPGTIVKGEQGSGASASALIVAKGGEIRALGTDTEPIIFTSILDNIQPGQLTGTNLTATDQGLWGGVIVLGDAPISAGNGNTTSQIEGIPATSTYGQYGGTNPTDNSGTIKYVSIRHGGSLIGAGNEINGLTLGGVGSNTVVDNIEIISNLDDGIEFFGGTVNVTNLLVGFHGDDGIDIDMNYSGSIDNFLVKHSGWSDEGMEIDGPEGTTYTSGMFTATNGTLDSTVINGVSTGFPRLDLKSKAQGTITNLANIDQIKVRVSYGNACTTSEEDAFTHLTDAVPTLVLNNINYNTILVYTGSDDGPPYYAPCNVPASDQNAAENAVNSVPASGFNNSGFGWSWLAQHGHL